MLSYLTEPNYPRAAIGVEKDRITAVELQREGRGRFGIKRAATVEVPNGLIEPNFLEQNISDPVQTRAYIDEALTVAGLLGQKAWSASLPSNTARTAILSVDSDSIKRGDKEQIIDWKAEQIFGAPAAEMRISRQKIASEENGKTRYLATAIKLSVIDEYERIFEDLGLKVGLILPRAVSEVNWLDSRKSSDTLLISSQDDGFTALLLRNGEPSVVRSVTCTTGELDDEIYRLLMFYNDRFAADGNGTLNDLLAVGRGLVPDKLIEISKEALGRALNVLGPADVGLSLPQGQLSFVDLAAPSGLAALGWHS